MACIAGRINFLPGFGIITIRKINATLQPDFLPITSSDSGEKIGKVSDVFMCMVTPPNRQGYVNLGLTNFYSMQVIRDGRASGKQRVTIGEVNDQMPTIFGNNWLHVSEFDYFVEHSTPMPAFGRGEPGEIEKKIAGHVLELINDGDTIQMGVGGIPEAVVSGLEGKRDLGVLTEMFPIGLPDLVKKGIVTNALKPFHIGVTVATFCIGDQGLYDYIPMKTLLVSFIQPLTPIIRHSLRSIPTWSPSIYGALCGFERPDIFGRPGAPDGKRYRRSARFHDRFILFQRWQGDYPGQFVEKIERRHTCLFDCS
jgi:acyl-CoA hydrolase